ncbi:hypothetical protein D9757_006662 [Collybiopsis confluens]|uniref:Uncharacterized protein n=1 Tax=Collybiopsis confluens TaxID=2823264 RepID=A0A8H5MA55_9AGAR|nr:hypothetical protein D9757_006662 [Collybiopsis confluens]
MPHIDFQDNISASLIGNRLFIDLNIDQAIDAVMDRANLTRLEHARHNAFSYSTNLRNLEAPWGLVYRIFLESVKGVLDTSMEVEEQIRVTAWNDSSNAPPQDLRRTLPLRSGIAKTVVPDLDVVLWGLIENLFPLLAELKPPITRAWLDIDGNPLHADATLSILARLWSNACNQVTYQARILFKKQKQTQKHQQSHIILMATVGDWFTCRGLNSSEDPTDLEELTQTLSVLIESEQKTTSGGEVACSHSIQAYVREENKNNPFFGKERPFVPIDLSREMAPPIPEELSKNCALVYGLPLSDEAFENYDMSRGPRMQGLLDVLHDLGISDRFLPATVRGFDKELQMVIPLPFCSFTTALHVEAGVGTVPIMEKQIELCRRLNVDPIHLKWYKRMI